MQIFREVKHVTALGRNEEACTDTFFSTFLVVQKIQHSNLHNNLSIFFCDALNCDVIDKLVKITLAATKNSV